LPRAKEGKRTPTIAERPIIDEKSGPFTSEEARILFDKTARRYMDMSGDQFLRAWENGEFRDADMKARAMRVAVLIPLVRKTRARKESC
jgi:hypothetical protein